MNKQQADAVVGGTFLIGLGLLFLLNWFWPGILLLIGVTALVDQWFKGRPAKGLITLLLFGGLALVLSVGVGLQIVFPIALITLGLVGLVDALIKR